MQIQDTATSSHLRHKLSVVVSLLALVMFLSGSSETFAQTKGDGMAPIPRVGNPAPDFSLKDFGGKSFILSKEWKSNVVALWFTNLCEGCQSRIPDVTRLRSRYEKKGVEVVAVSVLGKDRQTVEKVIRAKNAAFRFLYDPDGKATERYSGKFIEGTCPLKNLFLIDRGGTIRFASHLPGTSEQEIAKLLDQLIKGTKE